MTKTQRIVNVMVERIKSCSDLIGFTVNEQQDFNAETKLVMIDAMDLTPSLDYRRGTINSPMGTVRFSVRIVVGEYVEQGKQIAAIATSAIVGEPTMGGLCLPVNVRAANVVYDGVAPVKCFGFIVEAQWLVTMSKPDTF